MRKTERLIKALLDAPGTVHELADVTGIGVNSCRAMLNELCRLGAISRIGRVSRPVMVERTTTLYGVST